MSLSVHTQNILNDLRQRVVDSTTLIELNDAYDLFDEATLRLEKNELARQPADAQVLEDLKGQVELGIDAYNATSLKNQLEIQLPDGSKPKSTRSPKL